MIFYHRTTKENWDKIQEEGILYGRRYVLNNDGSIQREVSRCTYLATDIAEAMQYGDIVLEVEYEPSTNPKKNNYVDGCWQVRVYEPIPIDKFSLVTIKKHK